MGKLINLLKPRFIVYGPNYQDLRRDGYCCENIEPYWLFITQMDQDSIFQNLAWCEKYYKRQSNKSICQKKSVGIIQ